MDHRHLSQMRLDDEISRRALEMFFETLDPMKLYFYQSDIDKFDAESTTIDDYVAKGDVALAKRIFDVFLQRVNERTAVAQELVDADARLYRRRVDGPRSREDHLDRRRRKKPTSGGASG